MAVEPGELKLTALDIQAIEDAAERARQSERTTIEARRKADWVKVELGKMFEGLIYYPTATWTDVCAYIRGRCIFELGLSAVRVTHTFVGMKDDEGPYHDVVVVSALGYDRSLTTKIRINTGVIYPEDRPRTGEERFWDKY